MVLKTENLTKFYGRTVGIRGLNLSVQKGEIFGFLGPNGAGKTTTIRLLLSLIHPTEGRSFLFGEEVAQNSVAPRERIGYLPGDFQAYSFMTGKRFLDYMASFRSSGPVLREELMSELEFTPALLQRRIKHLSHGNRQKLGILHALEHDPDLAILDEPTLGLDPLMQEAFYRILIQRQEKGKTVFFSSHNLPEVEKVCHRIGIIRGGTLVSLETFEAMKKKIRRPMVIRFGKGFHVSAQTLEGATLRKTEGNKATFRVEGEIRKILEQLARLPVEDIIFPEPDLEDVFLSYYQGEE